jgi:hypothetical protein
MEELACRQGQTGFHKEFPWAAEWDMASGMEQESGKAPEQATGRGLESAYPGRSGFPEIGLAEFPQPGNPT